MTIRVGINGFGRMGKLTLQAGWASDELEFVHINEIKGDAACHAHLLQFDSVHGRWGQAKVITSTDTQINIDDSCISFSQYSTPEEVNWAAYEIDLLLECSGKFKTSEQLQTYFDQGIKKWKV